MGSAGNERLDVLNVATDGTGGVGRAWTFGGIALSSTRRPRAIPVYRVIFCHSVALSPAVVFFRRHVQVVVAATRQPLDDELFRAETAAASRAIDWVITEKASHFEALCACRGRDRPGLTALP